MEREGKDEDKRTETQVRTEKQREGPGKGKKEGMGSNDLISPDLIAALSLYALPGWLGRKKAVSHT